MVRDDYPLPYILAMRKPEDNTRSIGAHRAAVGWMVSAAISFLALRAVRSVVLANGLGPGSGPFLTVLSGASIVVPTLLLLIAVKHGLATKRASKSSRPHRAQRENWLNRLTWQRYEEAVENHFVQSGYRLKTVPAENNFPRRTVLTTTDDKSYLLVYENWRDETIHQPFLRRILDEVDSRSLNGGFFVGFGELTANAKEYAARRGLRLVMGKQLEEIVRASEWDTSRVRTGQTTSNLVTRPLAPQSAKR
jgi:hypothetical protein